MKTRLRLSLALLLLTTSCGGVGTTTPSTTPFPLATETPNFRFYYAGGDSVETDREETYHGWATLQLDVTLPQKVAYYKYRSRQNMGDHTGQYDTNGFAVPERLEIHTINSWDNHELVHIYTSRIGRPSNFFNEGIAVAFQMDPAAGDFVARFNGMAVHEACRQYLQSGALVVPLDRVIDDSGWKSISDTTLAYREAGSFVRFTIDRYGLARVLEFFRASTRDDDKSLIRSRFADAVGVSLDEAEQEWLSMLRSLAR